MPGYVRACVHNYLHSDWVKTQLALGTAEPRAESCWDVLSVGLGARDLLQEGVFVHVFSQVYGRRGGRTGRRL